MQTLNANTDNPLLIVHVYRRLVDGIDERTLHRILNPLLILATIALVVTIMFVAIVAVMALS